MRIILYGINFSPEVTGIGKYSGEMAFWLASRGHDVRVVCAPPYYPNWSVNYPYSSWKFSREKIDGVEIFRAPLWVPTRPTGVKRLLHLISFAVLSTPCLLWQIRWRPQAIIVVAPALACAPSGLLMGKLSKAKTWLHIQDFEVDAAFELALLKGKILRKFVSRIESILMQGFDRISSISSRMVDLARNKGVEPSKLVMFPNWVDISKIQPLTTASSYRAQLGLSPEHIVALYSGNMGAKQGLELLSEAAKILSNCEHIRFVFCGEGAGRPELERLSTGLANVQFLPLQPFEELSELLGMADIHLLPQKADAADLVMPSKLTGMFASGKVVLATTSADTELGRVIAGRGVIVSAGDPIELARAISELAANPERRRVLGLAGRLYAERNLDKDTILRDFESNLLNCGLAD